MGNILYVSMEKSPDPAIASIQDLIYNLLDVPAAIKC